MPAGRPEAIGPALSEPSWWTSNELMARLPAPNTYRWWPSADTLASMGLEPAPVLAAAASSKAILPVDGTMLWLLTMPLPALVT